MTGKGRVHRRDLLKGAAALAAFAELERAGAVPMNVGNGRTLLGGVNLAGLLPPGYGYRYWVDANGNNQLVLYQDASGNYYALYAPLGS